MKRALILVLSARRDPWGDLMDASLQTWDAEPHPQTQTLYYCAGHNGNTLQRPDVRYSAMEDSLENISPRTFEAFQWALEIEGWDYIARPNSSCYVHKGNLAAHIQTLPDSGVLRGMWTGGMEDQGFLWGGGQFILSRDVVAAMVAQGGWRDKLMDDEAITRSAQGLGISMHQGAVAATIGDNHDKSFTCVVYGLGENFTFTDWADVRKADGHFFFRVKQDHDRHMDVRIMRELKKHLPA